MFFLRQSLIRLPLFLQSGREARRDAGRERPAEGEERMPEVDFAFLLAAGGIIVVMLAAYVYATVSEPKSFFRRPVGQVQVRDLRKVKN